MSSLVLQSSKDLAAQRKSKVSLASSSVHRIDKSSSRLKMRKKSFGFNSISGVKPIDRSSFTTAIEFKRPPVIYLPTYQLESRLPFKVAEVSTIVNKMLDVFFTGHKYNIIESPQLALVVSTEIMRRVKERHYNRYRIIAVVTVGQKRAQSYNNAIAFIWDYERDAYVDVHREANTVFIQATVFGVYLD